MAASSCPIPKLGGLFVSNIYTPPIRGRQKSIDWSLGVVIIHLTVLGLRVWFKKGWGLLNTGPMTLSCQNLTLGMFSLSLPLRVAL